MKEIDKTIEIMCRTIQKRLEVSTSSGISKDTIDATHALAELIKADASYSISKHTPYNVR